MTFKYIEKPLVVSDVTLSTIVEGLNIPVDFQPINLSSFPMQSIEFKFITATVQSCSKRKYTIGFVFRKNLVGKLLRITPESVSESIMILEGIYTDLSNTTVILIGKKGSKNDNKFQTLFTPHKLLKLVIRDFTSADNIQEYVSNILSDIDKIEARYE
jgi:hypothetical protein